MSSANGLTESARVTAPVASNTLGVNVFTAPGKAMVGERPKPFRWEFPENRAAAGADRSVTSAHESGPPSDG